MDDITKRFMALFAGLDRAYGTFVVDEDLSDGKDKKSGKAKTIASPWGEKEINLHLSGESGLGVVPLNDDGMSLWGAIDIDDYRPGVITTCIEFISTHNLPLIVCRSKSGGAHCYLFLREWVSAKLLQKQLRNIAAAMGFVGAEIFPKQVSLNRELGEVGNWINLPYQGTPTTRYAYNREGKTIALVEDFLEFAESQRVTKYQLKSLVVPEIEHPFADGPPCLQRLAQDKVPEGTRNNALFQFGVYAKMKYPEDWNEKLMDYNQSYVTDPLKWREIHDTIIKSVDRRDYGYKCTEEPMLSYCNRQLCLQRKYGIGGAGDGNHEIDLEMILDNLRKKVYRDLDGNETKDDPRWLLNVKGVCIEFSTSELTDQGKFGRRCMERCHFIPPRLPVPRWLNIITSKLNSVEVIEIPFETSPLAHILNALQHFIDQRGDADTRADLFDGKALKEDGAYLFKVDTFVEYLRARDRVQPNVRELWERLNSIGVTRHETTQRVGAKTHKLNYWRVPDVVLDMAPEKEVPTPDIEF